MALFLKFLFLEDIIKIYLTFELIVIIMDVHGLKKESEDGHDRYLLCIGDSYYTVSDSGPLTISAREIDEKGFKDDMEAFEEQSDGNGWFKVSGEDVPKRVREVCKEK